MAQNKYRRTNFINQQTVDGILEEDLVDNNWDLFEIKRPLTFFTLTRSYIGRPDLLSLKLFGKIEYWWILAKVNENIQDWWNDLQVGDVISVPSIADFEDWYAAIRARRK